MMMKVNTMKNHISRIIALKETLCTFDSLQMEVHWKGTGRSITTNSKFVYQLMEPYDQ